MFGSPLEDIPAQLLKDGIRSSYPSIEINSDFSEFRFVVEHATSTSFEDYIVRDLELKLNVPITRSTLMNPDYNLVGWYRDYLEENLYYHTQYELTTAELLDSLPAINALDLARELPFMDELSENEGDLTSSFTKNLDDFPQNYWFGTMGYVYPQEIIKVLTRCAPFPGDNNNWINPRVPRDNPIRFEITQDNFGFYKIFDRKRGFTAVVHEARLRHRTFSIGQWYADHCAREAGAEFPDVRAADWLVGRIYSDTCIGSPLERCAMEILHYSTPYRDEPDQYYFAKKRFEVSCDYRQISQLIIHDSMLGINLKIPRSLLENSEFNIVAWYEEYLYLHDMQLEDAEKILPTRPPVDLVAAAASKSVWSHVTSLVRQLLKKNKHEELEATFELNGVQVDRNKYPHLQQNAVAHSSKARQLPKPIIVTVKVNGQPAWGLLDSGSLGDFISSTLADQLKLKHEKLEVPLTVQLAMQGSRSKIAARTEVRLQYQGIDETRSLDVININSYDIGYSLDVSTSGLHRF